MIPVIFIQRHGSEGLELMLDYPHAQYVLFTLSYLACTEEGYIHKCSCSYNEQVLETYTGHAVRKVDANFWHSELYLPYAPFSLARVLSTGCGGLHLWETFF